MKSFMKSLAVKSLAAFALIGASILPAQAQDKTIKLGTMAWEDLLPITGVTKKVLEDQGYKVQVTEFAEWGIAYATLTRGDVQLLISQTNHVAQDYWNKNKSKLEKVSIVSHGLNQTLAVPKYVNIDSIEQLNANADTFGGKIIGIEPGAGIMRETKQAIKDYGLTLNLVESSTSGMTAALKSAVSNKEPIVVTMWDPTWMYHKFDMKFLKDPKGIYSPPETYNLIAQKGFSEKNPEAREILAGIFMPIDDVREINIAVNDGKTMDQAIKAWTDSHGDLMKRWENIKKY